MLQKEKPVNYTLFDNMIDFSHPSNSKAKVNAHLKIKTSCLKN